MNICEATKIAIRSDGFIYREEWKDVMKIRPTFSSACCIVYRANGEDPRKWWQPNAEDLIAEDWSYGSGSNDLISLSKV